MNEFMYVKPFPVFSIVETFAVLWKKEWRNKLKVGNHTYMYMGCVLCKARKRDEGPLTIHLVKEQFSCKRCNVSGDAYYLVMYVMDCGKLEARDWLFSHLSPLLEKK